jgi:hypothetical protein
VVEEFSVFSMVMNLCSIAEELEGEMRTGVVVDEMDWAELGVDVLLKEDMEDEEDRLSTFFILPKAADVCSWISWGMVLEVVKPPLVVITFWGINREKSAVLKTFFQSDSITHWRISREMLGKFAITTSYRSESKAQRIDSLFASFST